jgi:hypothetical protein
MKHADSCGAGKSENGYGDFNSPTETVEAWQNAEYEEFRRTLNLDYTENDATILDKEPFAGLWIPTDGGVTILRELDKDIQTKINDSISARYHPVADEVYARWISNFASEEEIRELDETVGRLERRGYHVNVFDVPD